MIDIDVGSATKGVTVEIRLIGVNRFKWRLNIASFFVGLASVIAPITITLKKDIHEPWLYYCPKCRRDIAYVKPEKPLTMTIACPHCNYQSLVGGTLEKPYLLNPDLLADDFEPCKYGCHFQEPYGFVPMAGCPIHD